MAAAAVLFYRYQLLRTYRKLDKMLSDARDGVFEERNFDETVVSALEAKWAAYLSATEVTAKQQAEEKEKIKTLIADISHQTKTPIANLSLYSELLLEQELSQDAEQYAVSMNEQVRKLNFLIATLVKMSRLETGILVLQPKRGSVDELLRNVYRQMLPKAEKKGLKLILEQREEKDPELISGQTKEEDLERISERVEEKGSEANAMQEDRWAVFDEKWTVEAVSNIVDNAVKYTEKGSVILCISSYELFCCIRVRDTGMGIPEEEYAEIFSRFYRSAAAAGTEGVGIGLYLAREILAQEGGYIKVSSRPGEGSVFSIYLPR